VTAPPTETIRGKLEAFVARWREYQGGERQEAQTFLNELFACYGVDRKEAGAIFEDRAAPGFLDLFWPDVCIVEMKRPSEAERLSEHLEQALEYWKRKSRDTGRAGRFVVLSAFEKFQVYEPPATWDRLLAEFDVDGLPDRFEALDFLRRNEPRFAEDAAELTRKAVALVTDVHGRLGDRGAESVDTLRHFTLQSVWCAFAEDLGMIPEHRFSRLVEGLLDDPKRSSADDLGQLFEWLNRPGPRPEHGLYQGVPYANGSLFEDPARVYLLPEELELLRQACGFKWRQVQPAIFGTLLEGALGRERVWAFGAHYTSEEDIRKVVEPTVVEPWLAQVEACQSLEDVDKTQRALATYSVLDPACGSGNFLYVAYRELRRIENLLRVRQRELRTEAGLGAAVSDVRFPLSNLYGIELEPFAVELARVTLWMAHRLAVDEFDLDEPTLPLAKLAGIRRGDALKIGWPPADAIISNPPYIGTKFMRSRLGDDYVRWLGAEFGVGVKDYAVYWFRKGHDHLPERGRAGLVATNSIREGKNREASLDYLTQNGGVITSAISSEPWSGAANVHVSIVNWVKRPRETPAQFVLDGLEVEGITTALHAGTGRFVGRPLRQNVGRQFFGVVPSGDGFILGAEEAAQILAREDEDYAHVVRPYLIGDDITSNPELAPTRWIIDFKEMSLEDAMKYPDALDIVRKLVKPHRDVHKKRREREAWWKFSRTVPNLFSAIEKLPRYIACPHTSKRFHMVWCAPDWVPSNVTSAFAFPDDYSMGILTSSIHTRWATEQSTTFETRPRYTTASFLTFPWPQRQGDKCTAIAELSRAVTARRQEICAEREIGLTKLYNEVEDGAYRDLRNLHRQLDEAVASAYGWPKSAARDPAESNRRLLELNQAIAAGEIEYRPFD
jgi:hypothetical protein